MRNYDFSQGAWHITDWFNKLYLVLPRARNCTSGYFILDNNNKSIRQTSQNGSVLIECKTPRNIVLSGLEADAYGIFHNKQ